MNNEEEGNQTHFAHADLAIGFEQQPTHGHSNQVWTKTSPWFIVDFVEQSQRIVSVWHVIVLEGNEASG